MERCTGVMARAPGKLLLMRRAMAIECCLALIIGFILAPLQHVHRDEGHAHSPFIHAHLHAHHHDHVDKPGEREIENSDEDQASPVDTFLVVLTPDFSPFIPARAPGAVPEPAQTRVSFALVEERGHDPPCRPSSPPRAPPV
jgi:hypothetical protein